MRYARWMINLVLFGYMLFLALLTVPALLGFQIYAVVSGSMAPEIPAGAAVYVKSEDFENISVGDVITYSPGAESMKVTHRVAGKNRAQRYFVTKGDANEQPDGKQIAYEDVSGVVRFCVPHLGYAAVMLGSIGWKALLAGGLLWLLLVKSILDSMIKMRKERITI